MTAPRSLLALLFARDEARVRALLPSTEAGWRELLDRFDRLGAQGQWHAALRRLRCAELAPPDVRATLRHAHAVNAAQNLVLCDEAKRIMSAFAEAGVTLAPMKGVALFEEGVVRDLGARPTVDFDVVTLRRERPRVLALLHGLGFATSHTDASWKHLPAMWRGDVSIEVHEIAYWSARTREIFDATHLAARDRPTRLGRHCAVQLHHLVFGSPADATLLVKSLADLDAFFDLARADPGVAAAIVSSASEAGLDAELAACDALLAEARGDAPALGRAARPEAIAALLTPLEVTAPSDPRVESLVHALRLLRVQPLRVTLDMVTLLAFPPAGWVAENVGATPGRGALPAARLRRPFELVARIARALPSALRRRPGRSA